MRPTLFLILLFTMLGGYNVSGSHMPAGGPQVFHQSLKQQLVSPDIARDHSVYRSIILDTQAEYFEADGIEDEEDTDSQASKKCRMLARSTCASAYIIRLSRLHNYILPATTSLGASSRKYIVQGTLRI